MISLCCHDSGFTLCFFTKVLNMNPLYAPPGFYCGEAGLSFMAQEQVLHLSDFARLAHPRALARIAPGLALGIASLLLVG
jgi:hypothetical protein